VRIWLVLICPLFLAACAGRPYEIVDKDGSELFEIRTGTCFVGCNIKLRKPDGTRCKGYAIGLEDGMEASVSFSCPGDVPQQLTTTSLSRNAAAVGMLETKQAVEKRRAAYLDALQKKYR